MTPNESSPEPAAAATLDGPASSPGAPPAGTLSTMGKGRYQLIAQMAPSPFGALWVARVLGGAEDGRIVCIRRLGQKPLLDAAVLRRLATAAFVALDVRHARLAAALDVVVTETEVAVVTEYVEGELLRSLQRRVGLGNTPLDVSLALRLGLDAARAAIAARDGWRSATGADPALRSAVHGSLSPDSILLATYGEPLILDVGVGGLVLSRPELLRHAEVVPYCAPEQLTSGVAEEHSDVFTLGILLWELLANRPLFGSPRWLRFLGDADDVAAAEEAARARRRVMEMPIPRLDAVVRAGASVPKDVATLVARALERNPAGRFASLEALADALEGLGDGRLAAAEAVAAALTEIAGTSLEARRLAISSVTGQVTSTREDRVDSVRPTLPPGASNAPATRLVELASSPEALRSLENKDKKPPPIPKRRRQESIP